MKQAEWIWYPDDFEIELSGKFMAERYERDIPIPPFWRLDSCYKNVKFKKIYELSAAETVKIEAEGSFNVMIDGAYLYSVKSEFSVPRGKHEILVSVFNDKGLPCLKLAGDTILTDDTWQVTCCDHIFKNAACDGEFLNGKTPNGFSLPSKERAYVEKFPSDTGDIYDFGEEMFARVVFSGAKLSDNAKIYYGESLEEVSDKEHCELLSEDFVVNGDKVTTKIAKAFRYVTAEGIDFSGISVDEELSPSVLRSSFECDNQTVNEIYKVAARTMGLCSREFILDGIKRDRWVWMGDSAQSIMMNWYCFYDTEIARRTLIAFGGKGEVTQYLNTINDYTLYWFSAIADYYRHTGDIAFLKEIYPRVLAHIDFCVSRLDSDGFMVGKEGDWVFVDWGEGLTKEGALSFLQILLWRAFRIVAEISAILGDEKNEKEYSSRADCLFNVINDNFWNEECGAFIWSSCDERIFRQPNIMAIMTGFANDGQKEKISALLHNEECPKISTPYMRFYELAVLAELGDTEYVLHEILDYWGGMLLKGATSFWEKYDPSEDEISCLAMYGRK